MVHVRQRIGILIARANAEFILAMNSGDDINGSCLKEYNSRQFTQREEISSETAAVPFPGPFQAGP